MSEKVCANISITFIELIRIIYLRYGDTSYVKINDDIRIYNLAICDDWNRKFSSLAHEKNHCSN